MNRRIAAHKNRKGISVVDEAESADSRGPGSSRAAAAAARVAARYAKAPSYSELQASEARTALRAAEVATRAALEAQAVAQAALDNLDRHEEQIQAQHAQTEEASWTGYEAVETAEPAYAPEQSLEIRWEPDMPAPRQHSYEPVQYAEPEPWERAEQLSGRIEYVEEVEAAQPIPANLIEFPRELIATRRIRPRLTETHATGSPEAGSQLSIFEVDPSSISIEPEMHSAQAPSWSGQEWRAIELDAVAEEPEYRHEPAAARTVLHQAPMQLRAMATMVDAAVILTMFCGLAALVAKTFDRLPGIRVSEVLGVIVLLAIGIGYEALFLLYAKCTPGMRFAELSLCTFDEQYPTREQMKVRLNAMIVSLLPVGLGMLWTLFDEDSLSWHDRHSQTYLRHS